MYKFVGLFNILPLAILWISSVKIFYSCYKQVTPSIFTEDHTCREKVSEPTLARNREITRNLEMSISMGELSRTVTANCVMSGNQTCKGKKKQLFCLVFLVGWLVCWFFFFWWDFLDLKYNLFLSSWQLWGRKIFLKIHLIKSKAYFLEKHFILNHLRLENF